MSWSTPSNEQNILQYEVKFRRIGHIQYNLWRFVNITGSPPATTTNLKNLGIGAAFRVLVRAWSEAGPGKWSDVAVLNTYGGEFTHSCMQCLPHRIVSLK